jgi:hypothetical protein
MNMRMNSLRWLSILYSVAVLAAFAAGHGSEATLRLNSPAPGIHAGKWIQGEPVTEFEQGKTYLIAFWATRLPASWA